MISKSLNDQLVDAMFDLSRCMKEGMTFDSDSSQLTILQFQTLIFIKKRDIVTMSEVATQFKISLPTATVLSDKLVNADLIERRNDASDRRIVKLVLTQKGSNLLMQAMKQRQLKVGKMLSYLSNEDKDQLLKIIKTLVTNIEKQNEK